MDLLDDRNLEELGVIKEIDTLEIIRKANEIKEKKNRKVMIIFLSIATVFSMITQVVFFRFFGVNKIQLIAMAIYMMVMCVVLGLFCVRGGEIV